MHICTCVATVLWTSDRWLILASSSCTSSNLCLSCCSCSSSAVCFCRYLWYTASWSLPVTQPKHLILSPYLLTRHNVQFFFVYLFFFNLLHTCTYLFNIKNTVYSLVSKQESELNLNFISFIFIQLFVRWQVYVTEHWYPLSLSFKQLPIHVLLFWFMTNWQ